MEKFIISKTKQAPHYFHLRIVFLVLFLWLFSHPMAVMAQERLNKLVEERGLLHRQWQESEGQKSGIFGNRTKKDMTATNAWMERIIQKDNQIMSELEMLKNIATTEIGYEKEDYKYIAQKAEADIIKLKRALKNKDEAILKERGKMRTYEWTTLIFFLTTILLGWLFYKARQNHKSYG
ncbi:MAG: Clp protease ClpB [Cyclobacteriaceae bacterium]